MTKYLALIALFLFAYASFAQNKGARDKGVFGNWKNPKGSVIQIYACGSNVCARLIAISSKAPTRFDEENPNPALRKRPLCDLRIGSGFHLAGRNRAQGGWLYDPESGKTYHGTMTRSGTTLHLRGYVGLPIFGRTETWTRAPADLQHCHS